MGRRKTRTKELARRWRKKKHARQKLRQVRNKAEAVERAIQRMDDPENRYVFATITIAGTTVPSSFPPMRRMWT